MVSEGLKAIASLRADQKKAADDARKIKDAELTRAARVETLTTTAEGLSKKGDHAGAVKTYREALGLKPGDVNLLASLSRAEADLKREKERDDRIAAAKKGKTEALKLIAAGKVQMAAKKHDVAAELFRRALVQDATNAEAKSLLAQAEKLGPMGGKKADYQLAMEGGNLALEKGNVKGAINSFREALRLFPGDAEATKALANAEAREKAAMAAEKTKAYDAAMKRGNALLAGNKFKEAEAAFNDALLAKPGDLAAIKGKKEAEAGAKPDPKKAAYAKAIAGAAAAYKAGKYAEAQKLYDDALEVIPGDKVAIEGKTAAVTALREERYQTAMKSGNALLAGRKWKEAGTFFDQALKLKPGDKTALAGKAKAEVGEKPPVNPKKVAYDKAMAAARAAHAADKYGEAVKHYNDALDAVPGDKAAIDGKAASLKEATEAAYQGHLKNGQKLLAAKKFKESEAAFDQALKLKPGDPAAIKGKREAEAGGKPPVNPRKVAYDKAMAEASAALKAGKNEDAKKAYERAIAAMPDTKEAEAGLAEAQKRLNAEAYVTVMKRGQALMMDKKFKEAEAAYDTALRLKPGDAAAVAGKKAAQAAQKPTEPPKKTAEFSRQISLAQTAEKSGKLAEALAAFRDALKAVADDTGRKAEQARAYAGIGRIEHARKNFDEAVTAYEEVLKRTPTDATVKAALARAKKKM